MTTLIIFDSNFDEKKEKINLLKIKFSNEMIELNPIFFDVVNYLQQKKNADYFS